MNKLILLLFGALFLTQIVNADFDNNTQTLTSTSTSTATATNAGNGGAGGTGGTGGTAFGGVGVGGRADSDSSSGGNSMSVDAQTHQIRQYRIAPAISNGAAAGVDGIGVSTPFGGAMYNKGNRFLNTLALYNLKAANGMDCAREIAIMERETQESQFLGILPIDTPFGLGQMKPLAQPSIKNEEPSPTRDSKTGRYISVKDKAVSGNGGVVVGKV